MSTLFRSPLTRILPDEFSIHCDFGNYGFSKLLADAGVFPKSRANVPSDAMQIIFVALVFCRLHPDLAYQAQFNTLASSYGLPNQFFTLGNLLPIGGRQRCGKNTLRISLLKLDYINAESFFNNGLLLCAFQEMNQYYRISENLVPMPSHEVQNPSHGNYTSMFTNGSIIDRDLVATDADLNRSTIPVYTVAKPERYFDVDHITTSGNVFDSLDAQGNPVSKFNTIKLLDKDGNVAETRRVFPLVKIENKFFLQQSDSYEIESKPETLLLMGAGLTFDNATSFERFSRIVGVKMCADFDNIEVVEKTTTLGIAILRPAHLAVQQAHESQARVRTSSVEGVANTAAPGRQPTSQAPRGSYGGRGSSGGRGGRPAQGSGGGNSGQDFGVDNNGRQQYETGFTDPVETRGRGGRGRQRGRGNA
jgi:hypothetical protein